MRPSALVQTAAACFLNREDAAFLECFGEDVRIYSEPAVSDRPIVESRAALARWLACLRRQQLSAELGEVTDHGKGAVCDLIVTRGAMPSEVWRVALGVCVADDEMSELRAFWSREVAEGWVAQFR